jgi:hypothetical protein
VLGVLMSDRSPGPGWVDAGPVVERPTKTLAEYGPALPLTVRPSMPSPRSMSLTEQADVLVASEGLSYRDALRRASIEDPDAYARWRAQILPGVR